MSGFLTFHVPSSQRGKQEPHLQILSSDIATPEVGVLIHRCPNSLAASVLVNLRRFICLDWVQFETGKLAVVLQREGCVYSSGEKFRKAESWSNTRLCSVMLLCATVQLVYLGSFKALAVVSAFTLPPQNSSGCLDSSFPTNFCLFVCLFESLEWNSSSFAKKHEEESLELLKNLFFRSYLD